jgi:hypothetical protein
VVGLPSPRSATANAGARGAAQAGNRLPLHAHLNRFGRQHPEVQPRRREKLQIAGSREEPYTCSNGRSTTCWRSSTCTVNCVRGRRGGPGRARVGGTGSRDPAATPE